MKNEATILRTETLMAPSPIREAIIAKKHEGAKRTQ